MIPLALAPAAPAAASTVAPPGAGPTATVTLLTGDKVTVTMTADGATSPQVRDERGRPVGFLAQRRGRDTFVYPGPALPYVSAGLLDKQLFNLTELVEDGYDDAHSDRLPLIVRYADKSARVRSSASVDSAEKVLDLESIQGAALKAERSDDFWTSITSTGRSRVAGDATALGGGITKIWLDGKSKGALAESTAQIGAPRVWAGGNIGAGVDVAVLDSGIDPDHPDLAGRIVATKNFVPEFPIFDRLGHGTHVASTIAGSGAASGGVEKGVAPGVRLHIGKVLGDNNYGENSGIIEGMEWAARDQHAKIINLSLGDEPTDGTDPMSLAVNELSAETGALFVVAAGNQGREYGIGTPAAADAALSVGAVDSSDALAGFSSRGPRLGDRAVKPDLTAPGTEILAARSQYAKEGEGSYLVMSGTSMATPHVAGAAALLAAEHPGLNGEQLKQLLTSTTKQLPGMTAYEGGTGRLDVAAANKATLFGSGSVNFGYAEWTSPAVHAPVTRPVRYTNLGDAPVTLDLSASFTGLPAGQLTLSPPRLTVPAHGNAEVQVTASFDGMPFDQAFSGFLTATAGSVTMRTTLSAGQETERHKLVVTTRDRSGKPLAGTLTVMGADGTFEYVSVGATGTATLRLPVDTYAAWFSGDVEGVHGPYSKGAVLMPANGLKLDRDRSVVLDAAKAERVRTTTPDRADVTEASFSFSQQSRIAGGSNWFTMAAPDASYDSVWALPTGSAETDGFAFGTRWRLTQPALEIAGYDDLRAQHAARPLPAGSSRVDAVLAGDRDVRGKALVVRHDTAKKIEDEAAAAAAAGARMLVVVNDGAGRLAPWATSEWGPVDPPPVTVVTLSHDQGNQLISRLQRERRVRLDVTSNPSAKYVYDLQRDYQGGLPADLTYRADKSNLARITASYRNWRSDRVLQARGGRGAGTTMTSLTPAPAPAQGERTEWVTAGIPWSTQVTIPNVISQQSEWKTYRAGDRATETWLSPVQRPRLAGVSDTVVRHSGGAFQASVPGWGDSGTAHMGAMAWGLAQQSLLLYQAGDLIARSDDDNAGLYLTLAPERLPYRLVSENSRGEDAGPYSTSTRTEWGFTSGPVRSGQDEKPALIQLDYAVETDPAGKAGRHADLDVTPSTLPGVVGAGSIRMVTVDVSYDDGRTWQRTRLRPEGHTWRARLDAPRTAAFVTLRTTASDSRGNTVEQRITRAFGLK
ncbi:S8 family peptidase [Paractinoplanes atraurantiacus]|uniref:S8 family peptidase n=1 Tax=Paractinoplanes atraurantiacus TaxID=1036182 RepID=UPI001FE6DDC3|nr:S8 family serine peptidase [Actinoplanes atraurantiacus]